MIYRRSTVGAACLVGSFALAVACWPIDRWLHRHDFRLTD